MIKQYTFYLTLGVFLLACFAVTGYAGSINCTIKETQGSLVIMTCPGEGTRVVNMGGSADLYKPGDSITYTEPSNRNQQEKRRVR